MLRAGLIALLLLGVGSTAMASDRLVCTWESITTTASITRIEVEVIGDGMTAGATGITAVLLRPSRLLLLEALPLSREGLEYPRGYHGGRHWHDRHHDRRWHRH